MEMKNKLIVLSGGGSGGPVTPLLALAPDLRAAGYELAWVGTMDGVERKMVQEHDITYQAISAGKFRRYFSLQNFFDAFRVLAGFFESLNYLSKKRPALVMTAGGFVSVPLVWAAWALHIKVIVHQQDIRPGLANRLMAPFADVVTVTFEKSLKDFGKKAVWTGNPVRAAFRNVVSRKKEGARPRLLVLGGGTGAAALNNLVVDSLPQLLEFADVVHVTGGKTEKNIETKAGYTPYDFLSEERMAQEMADADLVVTRAGLGALTELAYLGKPTIIIPMPGSHQEVNAIYFAEKEAAVVINQEHMQVVDCIAGIKTFLYDGEKRQQVSTKMHSLMKSDAVEALMKLVSEV